MRLEAEVHFGRELQLQRGVFGLFHAISLDDELDWLLQSAAVSFLLLGIRESMRDRSTACWYGGSSLPLQAAFQTEGRREASAGGTSPGGGRRLGELHSPQSEVTIRRGRHALGAVASGGSTEKVFSNFGEAELHTQVSEVVEMNMLGTCGAEDDVTKEEGMPARRLKLARRTERLQHACAPLRLRPSHSDKRTSAA